MRIRCDWRLLNRQQSSQVRKEQRRLRSPLFKTPIKHILSIKSWFFSERICYAAHCFKHLSDFCCRNNTWSHVLKKCRRMFTATLSVEKKKQMLFCMHMKGSLKQFWSFFSAETILKIASRCLGPEAFM